MKKIIRQNRVFLANIATLMSGKVAAAVITLMLTPIIARLFVPEHFGVAALFLSLATIFSPSASLRYDSAIVIAKSEDNAAVLLALSTRLLTATSLAIYFILLTLHYFNIPVPYAGKLGVWIWAFPLSIFLFGLVSIMENWLTREKQFKKMAYNYTTGTLLTTGSRLSLGLVFGSTIWGLIIGQFIGLTGRVGILLSAQRKLSRMLWGDAPWGRLKAVAKEYSDFPTQSAPTALVFNLSTQLPILMLGLLYTPAVVGAYAMANRLTQMPITTAADSIRKVLLQKLTEMSKLEKGLTRAYVKSTVAMALIGAIPFGILWMYGASLLSVLLGERWLSAGQYVEILAPWLFMMWILVPANPAVMVLRKQKLWLRIQTGSLIGRSLVFVAAYMLTKTPIWTLNALVIVSMLGQATTLFVILSVVRKSDLALAHEISSRGL